MVSVQIMVMVGGEISGKLVEITMRDTSGDPENLFPDRRTCSLLPWARRRARSCSSFVKLLCFHGEIITTASNQGKEVSQLRHIEIA